MHIDYLDQHRDLVATLADWHHVQWGHLFDDWGIEVVRAELEGHATRRTLPTTLVMVEDAKPLGSVSLVLEDAPEFCDQGSPWLASLYVAPEYRGRGLGARLVHAAVDAAAGQGIDQLFLFTPEHADFYQRLGWSRMLRTTLKGTPVDLMTIRPLLHKAKAVA
jgi:GNAT superfamily N-acetyltransferase